MAISLGTCAGWSASAAKPANPETTPATPREYFNTGTRDLREGKLREAEACLQTALAAQDQRLQSPALYNLGHVRFAQGAEELKKGPSANSTSALARMAEQQGDEAIRAADDALESNEIPKMIQAYLNGRGKRRELKMAREAVLQAIKAHGATLLKWQRSCGDFKSALELDRNQADAEFNANVVERRIAQLVDDLRQLQQNAQMCSGKCDKLGQKLKQLKGRIPASQMPPGAGQDDEEEEDSPLGKQESPKESPSREGKEMMLSPEQAGWLLEGFKLDNERRLPMGQMAPGDPKTQSLKPW